MHYKAQDIANFLDSKLQGDNIVINNVSSLDNIKSNSVVFVNKYKDKYIKSINDSKKNFLVLCLPDYLNCISKPHILAKNPRLAYAKVVKNFFQPEGNKKISSSAIVSSKAIIGNNVEIMQNSVIEEEVEIGNNVTIGYNVIIRKGTIIGENTIIKSNSVIGEEGYGFERDVNQVPIRIPHMGQVIIGRNVEIGSLNTICKGTIDHTIIEDNVKLSDQVHIAHNVFISKNSMIAAGTSVNGSAKVGSNVWIGPNSAIMNNINIADNVIIGLGSVVIKSVLQNTVVAGNPAKYIRRV